MPVIPSDFFTRLKYLNIIQTLTEASSSVDSVALTDQYVAYGGSDNTVWVHDISTGNIVQTLTEESSLVDGVALTDQYVAYGGADSTVWVNLDKISFPEL